ncbi:hypothetical protein O9853_18470 [Vibrio lentus]|nr:hypothetical protein [Vibrio lentus]
MAEIQPSIVVGDKVSATELTATDFLASTQLSAGDTIQLYVANTVPHTTPSDIVGSEVIVNVDMIATQP